MINIPDSENKSRNEHIGWYALVLFRDRTFLELKSFLSKMRDSPTAKLSDFEFEVIKKAIDMHRAYNHIKIQQTKNENISKETPTGSTGS